MVDIDLGIIGVGVGVAVVVEQMKMDRDLEVVGDMKVGRKFAEEDNTNLKTDLGHRMFGTRKDLAIAVHRNLRNHPL